MKSEQPKLVSVATRVRLAVGFGIYFGWVSIIHYGHSIGVEGHLGTALASSVSIVSAGVFAAAFFLGRQDRSWNLGRYYRAGACAMAFLGTLCLSAEALRFFVPLLIGSTVAWFRLAYAEHFAVLGGKGTLGILGGAFAVCAAVFGGAQFIQPSAVLSGAADTRSWPSSWHRRRRSPNRGTFALRWSSAWYSRASG
ncbi:MAG: hypothetical protein AB2L09_10640 [Coriobacteriia bacterium]